MELHAVFVCQSQGGIVLPLGLQFLAPNDTNGTKTVFVARIGRGGDMVGIGPTKGEQGMLVLDLCFMQVVFEFAVLVPRNQRMDGVLTLQVELNALFVEKGYVNMLIGDSQTKADGLNSLLFQKINTYLY